MKHNFHNEIAILHKVNEKFPGKMMLSINNSNSFENLELFRHKSRGVLDRNYPWKYACPREHGCINLDTSKV